MKLKPVKIRILGIKITFGVNRIKEWLSEMVTDSIEWPKMSQHLQLHGMTPDQADAATNYARTWLAQEIADAIPAE